MFDSLNGSLFERSERENNEDRRREERWKEKEERRDFKKERFLFKSLNWEEEESKERPFFGHYS